MHAKLLELVLYGNTVVRIRWELHILATSQQRSPPSTPCLVLAHKNSKLLALLVVSGDDAHGAYWFFCALFGLIMTPIFLGAHPDVFSRDIYMREFASLPIWMMCVAIAIEKITGRRLFARVEASLVRRFPGAFAKLDAPECAGGEA